MNKVKRGAEAVLAVLIIMLMLWGTWSSTWGRPGHSCEAPPETADKLLRAAEEMTVEEMHEFNTAYIDAMCQIHAMEGMSRAFWRVGIEGEQVIATVQCEAQEQEL